MAEMKGVKDWERRNMTKLEEMPGHRGDQKKSPKIH